RRSLFPDFDRTEAGSLQETTCPSLARKTRRLSRPLLSTIRFATRRTARIEAALRSTRRVRLPQSTRGQSPARGSSTCESPRTKTAVSQSTQISAAIESKDKTVRAGLARIQNRSVAVDRTSNRSRFVVLRDQVR